MTSRRWTFILALFLTLELSGHAALQISNAGGASNIQFSTATLNADVISTGAAAPEVVFYWGPADRETNLTWLHTNDYGVAATTGVYSVNITGLNTNTVYWFRSFASNSTETAWATNSVSWTSRTVTTVGKFILVATNGQILNCTEFAAANGFAGSNEVAAFAGLLLTFSNRLSVFEAAASSFSNAIDQVNAWSNAAENAKYLLSYGQTYPSVTQEWDFTTASNGADWAYANGATWVTNEGAKLPMAYYSTTWPDRTNCSRILFSSALTNFAYDVTIRTKSGNDSVPCSVQYTYNGVLYGIYTGYASQTNEWLIPAVNSWPFSITNFGRMFGFIQSGYEETYVQHVKIVRTEGVIGNTIQIMGNVIPSKRGLFLGDALSTWSGQYLTDVTEPRSRLITNADVKAMTPRWVGDTVRDVGSNKTYTADDATTNGWH